jgi:DNA modification methylase
LFKDLLERIGLNKRQIINELGQGLDHCFRFNSSQWGLPTRKNYETLLATYGIGNMPDYDVLLEKYNSEFYRVYNPQLTEGKPYISGLGNSGEVTGSVGKIQTKNDGTRQPTTILRHKRETGIHPTQKPTELMEYLIKTYTNEGETVLDNCMGSGTTGVACKKTGRHFIGIEKDEKYFDIAVSRVSAYCG